VQFDRLSVRRSARIALFAMLWQFCLPFAHALAARDELPGRTAICTAAGVQWVDVEGESLPSPRGEAKHCALCAFMHGDQSAICAATEKLASFTAAAGALLLIPESARPASHRSLPPPLRGPPQLS
jgi:ectoine hydroxylase-related dioxygenase (phytanoyl-CoA dioxygenase family)